MNNKTIYAKPIKIIPNFENGGYCIYCLKKLNPTKENKRYTKWKQQYHKKCDKERNFYFMTEGNLKILREKEKKNKEIITEKIKNQK